MSIYKKVFTDSMKIAWYNPKIWIFGLFAVFFGGSIELELFDNFFSPTKNVFFNISNVSVGGFFQLDTISKIPLAAANDFPTFAKLFLIFLIFTVFLAVIIVTAVLAQLIIVNKADRLRKENTYKDTSKEKTTEMIRANIDNVWSVTALNVGYKALIFLLFIIISLPIILTAANPVFWTDVAYMLMFIIALPIAISVAMIMRYATIFINLRKQSMLKAINSALELFKKNWLLTIEMSIILFLITVVGGLVVILLTWALSIPFYFAGLLLAFLPKQLFLVLLGLYILVAFLMFIIGASIITIFNIAVWTNLFNEIEGKSVEGKISQILNKLRNL